MNIYLCNLNNSNITGVQYQNGVESTSYIDTALKSLDNGNTLYFDVPTDLIKTATITPLTIKIKFDDDTLDVKVAYSDTYWNDEIDVTKLLANPLAINYVNDMASQIVKFKDLRKILKINADAVVATLESAFEE